MPLLWLILVFNSTFDAKPAEPYMLEPGASVSCNFEFTKNACDMVAEKIGLKVMRACSWGAQGDTLLGKIPEDHIKDAEVVCSGDFFYWFNAQFKEGCERAKTALDRLLKERGDRPMILATVPGVSGECINAELRKKCTGKCILYETPDYVGLHPTQEYQDAAFRSLVPQ